MSMCILFLISASTTPHCLPGSEPAFKKAVARRYLEMNLGTKPGFCLSPSYRLPLIRHCRTQCLTELEAGRTSVVYFRVPQEPLIWDLKSVMLKLKETQHLLQICECKMILGLHVPTWIGQCRCYVPAFDTIMAIC